MRHIGAHLRCREEEEVASSSLIFRSHATSSLPPSEDPKPARDSAPLFSGEPVKSQPFTRAAAPLTARPWWAESWPRRRFLLLVGVFIFFFSSLSLSPPTELPLPFYFFLKILFSALWRTPEELKSSALVLSRPQQSVRPLRGASVAMDWFQWGIFSSSSFFLLSLCFDQVEDTVSLTRGSLFPHSYMFHPDGLKSTWLRMFLHIF